MTSRTRRRTLSHTTLDPSTGDQPFRSRSSGGRTDDTPVDAPVDSTADSAVDSITASTSDASVGDDRNAWRRGVAVGLVAYLFSRLCILGGAAVRAMQVTVDERNDGKTADSALSIVTGVFTQWDGKWYLELVRVGYPRNVPPDITFNQLEARAAFFPMFPGAVRVVDAILPGGDTAAALALNFVLGAISVVLVGLLAMRVFDASVATRSMVLYAVFPGSFVLSFAYSEALFIVFAATSLLFLLDEQWLLAGLAAALATGTRPNGVAIAFACLVAAVIAIRRKRDWSALLAVLVAPLGFISFQLYVDHRAGERGVWFRVQREAWAEGTSFGMTALRNSFGFLMDPFASPADAFTFLSIVALGIMVAAAYKRRLPWPWIAYSAIIAALMLLPETVTARPRFVFTAFPLFIAVAAWWPRPTAPAPAVGGRVSVLESVRTAWERYSWDFVLILCGAGLAILTNTYAVFAAIP